MFPGSPQAFRVVQASPAWRRYPPCHPNVTVYLVGYPAVIVVAFQLNQKDYYDYGYTSQFHILGPIDR